MVVRCTEDYRMVARCVEGDMEWFLGVKRGIEMTVRCAEGDME